MARRDQRQFGQRLRKAQLSGDKTLERFDYSHSPSVNHAMVAELATFGGSVTVEDHPKGTTLADGTRIAATKSCSFGVGKYVKASDVVAITRGALDAFEETLRVAGLRAN